MLFFRWKKINFESEKNEVKNFNNSILKKGKNEFSWRREAFRTPQGGICSTLYICWQRRDVENRQRLLFYENEVGNCYSSSQSLFWLIIYFVQKASTSPLHFISTIKTLGRKLFLISPRILCAKGRELNQSNSN